MQRPAVQHLLMLLFGWALHYASSKEDAKKFLYLQDPPDPDFPIQEYQGEDDKPAFLFDSDYPKPRIVEFYAHWCPHCQHFKPHYIDFAKKLQDITEHLPDHVQVETYAVSCVPNKDVCSQMKIHGYPTLRMYRAHSNNGTQVNIGGLNPRKILQDLGIQTDKYSQEAKPRAALPDTIRGSVKDPNVSQNQHFMARSIKETFDDAHLSLDFMLRNGVYTSPGPLSLSASNALVAFVAILSRVLPSSSSMYPLVSTLEKKRDRILTSEETMMDIMDTVDGPPSETWSPACLQHGTGYTCGLWTLFHIATIGLVEWNMDMGDPKQRLAPLEVADALRNCIEHFFQCDDCRAHFISEYDNCHHDRCNRLVSDKYKSTLDEWKELPLWLYETHNGVNVRLRHERLANKEPDDTTAERQVQWPPAQECPNCWLSRGRWDEEQVYNYLRLQYWPEDYKTSRLQSGLTEKKQPQHHAHDDLPPMAIRKQQQQTSDLEAPHVPWPLMALALISLLSGYTWHRKRNFDLRGYHKKRESDEIC